MSFGPQCHYVILGIDRKASDEEIKRAYRKLALQWHPDRNFGREEEAAEMYRRIQEAYEVLSDAQDRSWYDQHREAILRGRQPGDAVDDGVDLMPYFMTSCYRGYGDDKFGFYSIYRDIFDQISQLEKDARGIVDTDNTSSTSDSGFTPSTPTTPSVPKNTFSSSVPKKKFNVDDIDDIDDGAYAGIDDIDEDMGGYGGIDNIDDDMGGIDDIDGDVNTTRANTDADGPTAATSSETPAAKSKKPAFASYPSFGTSSSSPADVRYFYTYWLNFATSRSFAWHDQYNPQDAENRRIRRLIDAENRKTRMAKRREFNENVRRLVLFVQKHDMRWRALKAQEMRDEEAKRKKEIEMKKAAEEAKKLAREKAQKEEQARLEEQLQRHRELYGEEEDEDEEEEEETCLFACEACNKVFKTSNQMKQHCQSKKHRQQQQAWEREHKQKQAAAQSQKKGNGARGNGAGKGVDADEEEKARLRKELLEEEEMMLKLLSLEDSGKKSGSAKNAGRNDKNAQPVVKFKSLFKGPKSKVVVSESEEEEEDEDEESDEEVVAGKHVKHGGGKGVQTRVSRAVSDDEEEDEDEEDDMLLRLMQKKTPATKKVVESESEEEEEDEDEEEDEEEEEEEEDEDEDEEEEPQKVASSAPAVPLSKKEQRRLEQQHNIAMKAKKRELEKKEAEKKRQEARRAHKTAVKASLGINVSKKSMKQLQSMGANVNVKTAKNAQNKKNQKGRKGRRGDDSDDSS